MTRLRAHKATMTMLREEFERFAAHHADLTARTSLDLPAEERLANGAAFVLLQSDAKVLIAAMQRLLPDLGVPTDDAELGRGRARIAKEVRDRGDIIAACLTKTEAR